MPRVPVDYCERRELTRRCARTGQRVTLLMAPGGFGKTTLLAACCQTACADGVPTAWLSLSTEDTPTVLDRYLAYAFEEAGIELAATDASGPLAREVRYPRTSAVLYALEVREQPCLLVLDDLECATDPESAALLSFVLRGAARCLHVALSCRELPAGLDAAVAVLGADSEVLTVDDLRFSSADVARFFDFRLSRSELAEVVEEAAGWPIALRMWCAEVEPDVPGNGVVARDIVENWIEGRFMSGFPDRERELLLDISLFDWFDATLVDEVLEQPEALDALLRMPRLAGLLAPEDGAGGAHRLHPVLRRYCEERRRKTLARYRRIQRRIGLAMARRGQTVLAMRHALSAGDPDLAGRLLIDAGGLRVWLQQGAERFVAADRMLTDGTVASDVRLAMVRCVAQAVSGDIAAARRTFAWLGPRLTAAQANGEKLDVEACMVRAILVRNGCEPVGSAAVDALVAETRRLADLPTVEAVVRGTMEYGLCLYHSLRAEFEAALEHGRRARALVLERSSYVRLIVDFQCGQVAMAQGSVQEAVKFYHSGRRAATGRFAGYPRLAAMGHLQMREIDRERNRITEDAHDAGLAKLLLRSGVDLGCYVVASDLAVDHALESNGPDRALSVLDEIWEQARAKGMPALERYLAGARVAILADVGRVDDAERTWTAAALPVEDAECLDLGGQSWREMEVVSCARLRMRIARREHEAARRFGHALVDVAAQRGLLRTRLRALALLILAERRAGAHDEAVRLVGEYVALCAASGYVRALVRTGEAGAKALGDYLRANPDGVLADRAEAVRRAMARGKAVVPVFRGKQREVLERLATHSDKDIAAALGLTAHGVRYHVRTIFRKLEVSGRAAAVRRARAIGMLTPD